MKLLSSIFFILLTPLLQAQNHSNDSFVAMAYLELERDVTIPIELERLTHKLNIWKENLGPDWQTEWPQFQKTIYALEQEQTAARNFLDSLNDAQVFSRMTVLEHAFMDHLQADKKLRKKYKNIQRRIQCLAEGRARYETRKQFYTVGGLALLDAAVNTVRACDPDETPANRKVASKQLENYASSGGYPISDNFFGRAFFTDHLARAHNWLPEGDPLFSRVFGGRNGTVFLEAIYGPENSDRITSLVAYTAQRDSIMHLGWNAIQTSTDPALAAARELVLLMRENEHLGLALETKEQALRDELGKAYMELFGKEVTVYFHVPTLHDN
jgi:hypothetical protein